MPAFVDALDLPTCKGVLTNGQYEYSCGLSVAEASIAGIGSGHWAVQAPGTFKSAHTVHHNAQGHDPTATLYYMSQNSQVMSATCSCLHET